MEGDGKRTIGRLLSHLRRATQMYLSRELEETDIGPGQMGHLMFLYHHQGTSQEEISEHVIVDKATTTRALSKLEDAGFIIREEDPLDRRIRRVYLTDKALKMRPMIREKMERWESILFSGFSDREVSQIIFLLERMERNAGDYMSDTPGSRN